MKSVCVILGKKKHKGLCYNQIISYLSKHNRKICNLKLLWSMGSKKQLQLLQAP